MCTARLCNSLYIHCMLLWCPSSLRMTMYLLLPSIGAFTTSWLIQRWNRHLPFNECCALQMVLLVMAPDAYKAKSLSSRVLTIHERLPIFIRPFLQRKRQCMMILCALLFLFSNRIALFIALVHVSIFRICEVIRVDHWQNLIISLSIPATDKLAFR